MATITSTATGDWSVGGTWVGGVAPIGTDSVVIAATHVVTKDTAEGTPDCVDITVNGTLAIGANGVKASGTFTGGDTGVLSITTGRFWTVGGSVFNSSQARLYIVGTSGDRAEFKSDGPIYIQNPATSNGDHSVKYCDLNNTSAQGRIYATRRGVWENCTFASEWRLYEGGRLDAKDCDIPATSNVLMINGSCVLNLDGGTLRGTIDMSSLLYNGMLAEVNLHNVSITPTSYITRSSERGAHFIVRSQGHDDVEGDWRIEVEGGAVLRSTASKKAGTYGIEFIPSSLCDASCPVSLDIPIPVDSGDTVAPSFYVYNATADADVQAASGRMVFTLDPGNEWGLREEIDASTLADVYLNWRQVAFTGGTASGTSKKGSVIVRVSLRRYIASAVVYVADMDDGVT